MKNLVRIVGCLLICAILFSCSATKKSAAADYYIASVNGKVLTHIVNAHLEGDVEFLIHALDKYPSLKGYTESYLYNRDFSNESYGHLKQYATAAQNDIEASIFFDSLVLNKQFATIDSLSNLSISAVGEFYKEKCEEHDYLKDVLRDAYFSDVQSLDYQSRKSLYNVFKDTNLVAEIEQPYHELRDSLLTEIKSELNPYFNSEREILKQIESEIRYEAQQYVETGLEKIIHAANEKNDRGLFKQIFKRENIDNYSFRDYINKVINETYDCSYIEKLAKDRLAEYINSSKQLRSLLFNQYFSDEEYEDIYISNNAIQNQFSWMIGRGEVNEVQNIKNVGTALTVGSLALGFIPGIGVIAAAADVADLAYGLSQDNQINQAVEQMANTIYNDSVICIDNYITTIFKDLAEAQQTTENNFIKVFNDDF